MVGPSLLHTQATRAAALVAPKLPPGPFHMILLILHLRPWDTGKLPPTGHIMSPSGCKLLPSGLEPAALWPSGSNLQPSGDIIFGPRAATFPVSRGRRCRIVTNLSQREVFFNDMGHPVYICLDAINHLCIQSLCLKEKARTFGEAFEMLWVCRHSDSRILYAH